MNKFAIHFALIVLFLICLPSCKGKKETSTSSVSSGSLAKKYAELLKVDEDEIKNKKLFQFIDSWYGTPYLYGGNDKKGVDCSGFTKNIFSGVYEKKIPRTAGSQYEACEPVKKEKLKEGDLVFFKIESKKISHVGFYLQNNKFIHASSKKGVVISDLDQAYYKKYFFAGGRVK